jgi:hypothetical protein
MLVVLEVKIFPEKSLAIRLRFFNLPDPRRGLGAQLR